MAVPRSYLPQREVYVWPFAAKSILCDRLYHGCAKVAHCVPARWRNFSHYCRPLRQYDVFWAQRSTDRRTNSRRCTHTSDYSVRVKYIVRHWASREASLCHNSGWGTEAFPLSSVICAPVVYTLIKQIKKGLKLKPLSAYDLSVSEDCAATEYLPRAVSNVISQSGKIDFQELSLPS